jgi:hypothetical protein
MIAVVIGSGLGGGIGNPFNVAHPNAHAATPQQGLLYFYLII